MRPLAALLLLVALGDPSAQDTAKNASVAPQLLRNEDGWAAALVKRDGVLRDAISGTDTVTAAHNEDMIVHQAGAVRAVVTGILVVQLRSMSKPSTHRYRFTDTCVKGDDGRWQIVAAQDYLIPGK